MDEKCIELTLAELQENNGKLDLWTDEYLFGRQYAEHRSTIEIWGGPEMHRSRLSLLLREGLTKERREKVFPGHYDLGNMRDIPIELCTYEKLADELFGRGRNNIESNDAFETIQKGIYRITGKKMQDHFKVNKSTALKVIKTLHMMKERISHLMQLLKLPKPDEKFSLSLRDAYPYEKNQDQVWGIADLKAYLSVEIGEERISEISGTFSLLQDRRNEVFINIERILIQMRRLRYGDLLAAYDALTAVISDYPLEPIEKADIPLDQVLFIHLYALDYAHFAVGYPQLIKAAVPEYAVTPVVEELLALTKKIFPSLSLTVKEYDPLIPLWNMSEFSKHWRDEIVPIMSKAMGMSLGDDRYEKMVEDAKCLLTSYYFFSDRTGSAPTTDQKNTSIWYVVAALCCVWYSSKFDSTFKPYWQGQSSQGGSINSSNKLPELKNALFIDDVPEEHRHIWANRLDWFANVLRGHIELTERRFAMRSALISKMLDICLHTNQTDWIAQEMASLIKNIKEHTFKFAQ